MDRSLFAVQEAGRAGLSGWFSKKRGPLGTLEPGLTRNYGEVPIKVAP